MRCVRSGPHPREDSATERVRVNLGQAAVARTNEVYRLTFASEPLCRAHAVEMILALSLAGVDASTVPLDYERDLSEARDLFRRMGL